MCKTFHKIGIMLYIIILAVCVCCNNIVSSLIVTHKTPFKLKREQSHNNTIRIPTAGTYCTFPLLRESIILNQLLRSCFDISVCGGDGQEFAEKIIFI